jgi:phage baseplate assembly protein W
MTDFLGRGVAFPFAPDAGGTLRYVDGDAGVSQSLRLLLMTASGERVMRPDFGTEAPELVFAPGSETNRKLLETTIRDAVRDHEPRVQLEDVVVSGRELEPERVDIEVTYTVRRTNTRDSIVFPFYLNRPGGLP